MNTYKTKAIPKILPEENFSSRTHTGSFALLLTLLFFSMLLIFPSIAKKAVYDALNLCALTLVPSLFPFMVAGEIFFALNAEKSLTGALERPFERIFEISGSGVTAFILGAVCGLPMGGKYALSLYKNGSISRDECERLMGICTNAGIGFTVVGVGYTLWGSSAFGWCLYICQIFSSFVSGFILSRSAKRVENPVSIEPTTCEISKKSISTLVTGAISSCAISMLKICAFTVFFSVLGSFICVSCELFTLPRLFSCTLLSFTEITFACSALRDFFLSGHVYAEHCAKILTFFAIGFAGLSAHFQLTSFALELDIKMRRYYVTKLLSGLICALTGAIVMQFLRI